MIWISIVFKLLQYFLRVEEHMPDKSAFVKELVRVTAPGGRIIVVTWCHRELNETKGESSLSPNELKLLKKINNGLLFLLDIRTILCTVNLIQFEFHDSLLLA